MGTYTVVVGAHGCPVVGVLNGGIALARFAEASPIWGRPAGIAGPTDVIVFLGTQNPA